MGSCPGAGTTGWHREGRVHSTPPPGGLPGRKKKGSEIKAPDRDVLASVFYKM